MGTETNTDPMTESPPDVWPPLAHIVPKPVVEGARALCGAKIDGIDLDDATNVCPKCIEIFGGKGE